MLYLFLFLGFLAIGDIQATPLGNVDSHTYFPMPKYPKMMARTFVNGDFEVEIQVEGGAVESIKVISAYVATRQKELAQSVPVFEQFFISNIENAAKKLAF